MVSFWRLFSLFFSEFDPYDFDLLVFSYGRLVCYVVFVVSSDFQLRFYDYYFKSACVFVPLIVSFSFYVFRSLLFANVIVIERFDVLFIEESLSTFPKPTGRRAQGGRSGANAFGFRFSEVPETSNAVGI